MLMLVIDRRLPRFVPNGGEWVTNALLEGISANGDVAVVTAMGDEAGWRKPGLVLRMWDSDPSERLQAAAAATTAVLWVSTTPVARIRARLGLDSGRAYREVPVANVVVADHHVDEGEVRVLGGLDGVRAVPSMPTRKARRKLVKFGKWLAPAARSHHRFDRADSAVRQRAAASAAEAAIGDLLEEEGVEEFQIRGSESLTVTYARTGREEVRPSPFETDDQLIEAARFIAAFGSNPQVFDPMNPSLDVKVGDRWRLHAEAWVVSPPSLVLRANMGGRLTLEDSGFACPDLSALLVEAIAGRVRANMVIAAPMFAGKTTLAQCLLAKVPAWERIDTIEDTAELGLAEFGIHANTYARMTRTPNNDGEGAHTMEHHIRDAKRAKTAKLVIGETRGEGTLALLDAMSSGLHGCLVTVHSGPGRAVLQKLVSYARLEGAEPGFARAQIALGVKLLVWVTRNGAGERVVADVTEVTGFDEATEMIRTRPLWTLRAGDRWATPVGRPDGFMAELYESAGFVIDREPAALPARTGLPASDPLPALAGRPR